MKIKTLLATALILALIASLAACAGGGSSGGTGSAAPQQTSSTAAQSTAQPAAAGAPEKLVYFVQPPANYQPTDPEVITQIQDKIAADTGAFVEPIIAPIDPTDYNNKLNLMLSSGEQIDIFLTNAWEPLHRSNMLADLTADVNADSALLEVFGTAFGAVQAADGQIYGIPRNGDAVHYPVWIRKDWLDKVGMPIPTTMDEYEAVMKAFKEQDPAGEGKTIPMLTKFEDMSNNLLGAFTDNGTGVYQSPDGKIMPYFMDPGYKDMLMRLAEWYKSGYIDKESFIYKDNQRVDLIKQGRVGSTVLWFSRVSLNEAELQKIDPAAEYVVASLSGDKGKAETVNAYARMPIGVSTAPGTSAYVVSAKCANVPLAVKVLSWGFTDKANFIISRYGLEGSAWNWIDEAKGIFKLEIPQTGDEMCMYKGLVTEMAVREEVSPNEKHIDYIYGKEIVNFARAKYPADGGIHFDMQALNDACPTIEDIRRIHNEESIKFITGGRSFDTYDAFLGELESAGMSVLVEEITNQFNAAKK